MLSFVDGMAVATGRTAHLHRLARHDRVPRRMRVQCAVMWNNCYVLKACTSFNRRAWAGMSEALERNGIEGLNSASPSRL